MIDKFLNENDKLLSYKKYNEINIFNRKKINENGPIGINYLIKKMTLITISDLLEPLIKIESQEMSHEDKQDFF